MNRKHIPTEIETAVLMKSARRCALCFILSRDLSEKRGQIAHLDQDPSNFAEDNLAFVCLDHHSLYDSTTSQHKNYTIAELKAARAELYKAISQLEHGITGDQSNITAGWEVRYPGGLADLSMVRTSEPAIVQRFAIGEDFTLINRSPHPVSLSALFLIVYGCTQLAVDPYSLQLGEWPRLLAAFGIRQKPQLLFPLNLAGHSAIEGHILVPIRPDGQGRGVGGDVPEKRQYVFEFEELLTGRKFSAVVSAIGAPDRDNHQCYSGTDLARPGPKQQPFSVD
jgi:hypothetical protein